MNVLKMKNISNNELAEELRNQITRRFEKLKVHSFSMYHIWHVDLTDIHLISKFNKAIRLSCVIDIFSEYAWIIPLTDKKDVKITNASQKILAESNCKPNKIPVDKCSKFFNRSVKSWLQDNHIEMSSIHNEVKSVVAERFIRILKNKICK